MTALSMWYLPYLTLPLMTIISNLTTYTLMCKPETLTHAVFFHPAKTQQNMVSTL